MIWTLLTCRRELAILRRAVARLTFERDEARAEVQRLRDAVERASRERWGR